MLNAIFGMMVTDPVKPIIEFNGKDFNVNFSNIQECLDAYNTRYDKFLVYEWGLYCTAYARRNLWTGIIAMGDDYNEKVTYAKQKWLKQHLASVNFDEINIVKYGTPKSTVVGIQGGILFDDEERNREEWNGFAYEPSEIIEVLNSLL